MSSTTTDNDNNLNDKWSAQADLYSDQAAKLTELHGADLVTLLKKDILQAKTILDVGCGTGAFARAYLQQFPKGVPGQTLILSDLSQGMLEKAKETVAVQSPEDFQTRIIFQQEDGTKLDGIEDDSIDLVVSLFGIFLIPDQPAVQKAITRVLKKEGGVFANASWMFEISSKLAELGFGLSLQDAFQVPITASNPNFKLKETSIYAWADRSRVQNILSDQYQFTTVETSNALHTSVWEFDKMWTMMYKNPVADLQSRSEADQQKAKDALKTFLTSNGSCLDQPLLLSTASILAIGRGNDGSRK